MKRIGRDTLIITVIAVAAVLALAVGALANGNSTASSPDQGNVVTVTLSDMNIASSQTSFQAGVDYHFVVTNAGQINHELMIMKPMAAGVMSMEQMDSMSVADIEADDLPSGATKTIDVTFEQAYPAGTLEFACHIDGHYEAGMHLGVTVNPAT